MQTAEVAGWVSVCEGGGIGTVSSIRRTLEGLSEKLLICGT